MSHEIIIPPVGESVTSALVARWHKAEGDSVKKGDILVTLETDKVSNELEAEFSGTLSISVPEGEEVEIGKVIGSIAEGSSAAPDSSAPKPSPEKPTPAQMEGKGGEVIEIKVPAAGDSITSATVAAWAVADGSFVNKGDVLVTLDTDKVSSELEAEASGTIKITIAEGTEVEIGATLGSLTTGAAPSGHAPSKPSAPEAQPVGKEAPAPQQVAIKETSPAPSKPSDETRVSRKKMTPLRRKIAQHLVNAQQTAAILTTFNEADMSAIMKLRKQIQEDFVAKHGVKLGFMSFFVKAVVQALKEVPSINARIEENDVIENHFFDIGVAIGTEKGLVVPVLRDCDTKSFAQIEQDIIDYAMKARDGKIEFSDLSGGVFTVSNGGVYGSLLSTPILNPPQSGILGMHTIQQRPMAVNGEVKILPMMYLALSYDHRLVDGKEAVTFLISIKNSIENPTRLMLEM
ncbi:dihydrolipoyllysine-residue succinyltransferase [Akkermansiaceae bacterium]|nr:dihydrolipoyllysine-residue succinyltransferase [Akkermansiaceae bacterium]